MWGFSSNKLLEQREQERTKRLHEQRVRGAKSTIKQKGMNKLPMGVRQKRTEGRSPPHSPDPSRSRPTSAHSAAGRKGAGGGPANRKPKLNTQADIGGVYGSYHDGEGGADDCPSPHSMDGFARGGGGGQYSECFSDAGGGSADELSDEIEDDGQYGNDYYSGSEGEYSGSSDEKDDPGEESILAQSTLEVGLTGLGPNQARPPSGSRLSSANSAQERRAFISAVRGGSAASQASSAADSNVSADSGLESTNAEKRAFIASVRSASRPSSAATSIDTASPTSALAPPRPPAPAPAPPPAPLQPALGGAGSATPVQGVGSRARALFFEFWDAQEAQMVTLLSRMGDTVEQAIVRNALYHLADELDFPVGELQVRTPHAFRCARPFR